MAWAAARVFLGLNGITPKEVDVDRAERFMMAVAAGDLVEVPDMARELRDLSGSA